MNPRCGCNQQTVTVIECVLYGTEINQAVQFERMWSLRTINAIGVSASATIMVEQTITDKQQTPTNNRHQQYSSAKRASNYQHNTIAQGSYKNKSHSTSRSNASIHTTQVTAYNVLIAPNFTHKASRREKCAVSRRYLSPQSLNLEYHALGVPSRNHSRLLTTLVHRIKRS